MKKIVGIRAGLWAYLIDDHSEHIKAKGTKKCNKKKTHDKKLYRLHA